MIVDKDSVTSVLYQEIESGDAKQNKGETQKFLPVRVHSPLIVSYRSERFRLCQILNNTIATESCLESVLMPEVP